MTTWITDDKGNRASVEFFGSEEAARAALATLKNCKNCTDCYSCTNCTDCMRCKNCTNCYYCTDCFYCTDCYYCTICMYCNYCTNCTKCTDCTDCKNCTKIHKATSPRVVGPFRSDGYQFVLNSDGGIRAGCRAFATMAEARDHWTKTRGGTPLGDETMAILDALEALDQIKSGEKK